MRVALLLLPERRRRLVHVTLLGYNVENLLPANQTLVVFVLVNKLRHEQKERPAFLLGSEAKKTHELLDVVPRVGRVRKEYVVRRYVPVSDGPVKVDLFVMHVSKTFELELVRRPAVAVVRIVNFRVGLTRYDGPHQGGNVPV